MTLKKATVSGFFLSDTIRSDGVLVIHFSVDECAWTFCFLLCNVLRYLLVVGLHRFLRFRLL